MGGLIMNRLVTVVVPPHEFSEEPSKLVPADPPLRCKLSLEVSPESLEAVDVISFAIGVLLLAVIDETMDVPLRCDAGVPFECIRADGGPPSYFPLNDRLEILPTHMFDELGEHLSFPAEDTEDRLLRRPSSTLAFRLRALRRQTLVLPCSTHVGFIDLHDAGELPTIDIARHRNACLLHDPQDRSLREPRVPLEERFRIPTIEKIMQNLDDCRRLLEQSSHTHAERVPAPRTPSST